MVQHGKKKTENIEKIRLVMLMYASSLYTRSFKFIKVIYESHREGFPPFFSSTHWPLSRYVHHWLWWQIYTVLEDHLFEQVWSIKTVNYLNIPSAPAQFSPGGTHPVHNPSLPLPLSDASHHSPPKVNISYEPISLHHSLTLIIIIYSTNTIRTYDTINGTQAKI